MDPVQSGVFAWAPYVSAPPATSAIALPSRDPWRGLGVLALLLGLALAVVTASGRASAQALNFAAQWGSLGAGPGQFNTPIGIATDPNGRVYVSDYGNARVQVFTRGGIFLTEWSTILPDLWTFSTPVGVAVGSAGEIFVTDYDFNRMLTFSDDGRFIRKWGEPGSGPGQFNYPYAVATVANGTVYVADHYNYRVQALSPLGAFVSQWPTQSDQGGPQAVATDDAGRVYVAAGTGIQVYSSTGALLARWGMPAGMEPIANARGVAVDLSGFVYVADAGRNRIVVFFSDGRFVAQIGSAGGAPGRFLGPHSVAVNAEGELFVLDTFNHRVQKFWDGPVAARPPSWGRLKRLFR